jgi:hypothetical protein
MKAYGVEWTGRDCPCCRPFRDVNYTHRAKRENVAEVRAGLADREAHHDDDEPMFESCESARPLFLRAPDGSLVPIKYVYPEHPDAYMTPEDWAKGTERTSYTIGERLAA